MKILLQSTLFYPSVGGVETVAQCLAERYTQLGHTCIVLTRSPSEKPDRFPFKVIRQPGLRQKIRLIKETDIVHGNGASIELVFIAWLLGKPLVWTHTSYLLQAVDGLGWVEGEKAPLEPWPSVMYHYRRFGFVWAVKEGIKLYIKRFAARFVTQHVAITEWVAKRQPFPGQVVIYNPFPLDRFASVSNLSATAEYDFVFLGRLVSEKGVPVLLEAFALLLNKRPGYQKNLLIIGDGNWRAKLEMMAGNLGISKRVVFAGRQTGRELLTWAAKGQIAVIPSAWEEPMGGVALEMLAAGKPVIVSQNGGLAECAGEAGLTFPNGDPNALCLKMEELLDDPGKVEVLRQRAADQVRKFDELELTRQYITLFERILNVS